jgi:plasmid stabilization system protein ParE
MTWPAHWSHAFRADYQEQFPYYLLAAGEEVAWRFDDSLQRTIAAISEHPMLGRPRFFRNPELAGIRSGRVKPPFNVMLVFYRAQSDGLYLVRLMQGSRDLTKTPRMRSDS